MCGIAGSFFVQRGYGRKLVRGMNALQQHRGPDASNEFVGDWFVLGHTRLSINGPGISGDQPFVSQNGRWVVVFNGEIYNHKELRTQIQAPLANTSDGAVIPELIAEGGPAQLGRLRGMYAITAVDVENRSVLLAADPFGIKPLYWSRVHGSIYVASELRALASLVGRHKADTRAIATFLFRGSMDCTESGIEGIFRVAPGSWISLNSGGVQSEGQISTEPFQRNRPATWEEAARSFESSVEAHLLADVPVALLLSDGVDSCSIAVAASRVSGTVTGITVDLGGSKDRGESRGASQIARGLGMSHIVVNEVPDNWSLRQFVGSMQRPTIDGLNTYLVSRVVHESGFKVALSGIGGDEILSGYTNVRRLGAFRLMNKLPAVLRVPLSRAIFTGSSLGSIQERWDSVSGDRARGLAPTYVDFQRQVWGRASAFRAAGVSPSQAVTIPAMQSIFATGLANRLSAAQLETYTSAQLLPDADTFSMAHSVELRVPFLDVPFAETVATIPKRRVGKGDFVEAMASPLLSASLAKPKQGFNLPMLKWLKSGHLQSAVDEVRSRNAPLYSHLEFSFVHEALNAWTRGELPWYRMWSLCVLNEWLRDL